MYVRHGRRGVGAWVGAWGGGPAMLSRCCFVHTQGFEFVRYEVHGISTDFLHTPLIVRDSEYMNVANPRV